MTRRRGRPSPMDLGTEDIADTGREAYELREQKMTFRQIAETQGVTVSAAFYRVRWHEAYLERQAEQLGC